MGPQDCIHTVCFLPEEGQAEFREKFENAVKDLDDYVVLADLLGEHQQMSYQKDFRWTRYPMLCRNEYADGDWLFNGVLLDQEVDLVGYGKDNIHHINEIILQDSDDEDE